MLPLASIQQQPAIAHLSGYRLYSNELSSTDSVCGKPQYQRIIDDQLGNGVLSLPVGQKYRLWPTTTLNLCNFSYCRLIYHPLTLRVTMFLIVKRTHLTDCGCRVLLRVSQKILSQIVAICPIGSYMLCPSCTFESIPLNTFERSGVVIDLSTSRRES